jgi:hypothetical protein
MMTVAMPVWKQMVQREKEEELIFRGQQYVRALRLFGRKYANASPPNIDVLVEQRFIRRKYKDPITNDDFQPILAGQGGAPGAPGGPARGGAPGRGAPGGAAPFGGLGGQPSPSPGPGPSGRSAAVSPITQAGAGRGVSPIGAPGGPTGGVIGVVSKSKDKSIRLYNGRSHYNEWAFINTVQVQAPGTPGTNAPGQRGRGQPGPPGQPGPTPSGGQRGRGTSPTAPPNVPPTAPGRPGGPGTFSPFQPGQPIQPIQPPPGRGRGE